MYAVHPKIILLFGYPLALGLARSFGKIGKKVILLYNDQFEIARYSKYCEAVQCPSFEDYAAVTNFLIKKKTDWAESLLIPTNDPQIELLSKNKKLLSQYYKVPVPEYTVVRMFLDKHETHKIAKKAGVPVPLTYNPKTYKESISFSETLRFPVMIKPYERHKFYNIFHKKLFIVKNIKELSEKLKDCYKNDLDIMITEIIPGPDTYIFQYTFYIDKEGNELAGISQQKLRQTPPNYGIGRVTRTVKNKEIMELSRIFIKSLPGFYGVASIEFKFDHRDGEYKLIEMNGRPPLQNWLFTTAGVNFADLYYQEWILKNKLTVNGYKLGLYWIDLYNDIRDSILANKYEKYSIREYLNPYLSRPVFAIESLSDAGPMSRFWLQVIRNSLNFIKKKKFRKEYY